MDVDICTGITDLINLFNEIYGFLRHFDSNLILLIACLFIHQVLLLELIELLYFVSLSICLFELLIKN